MEAMHIMVLVGLILFVLYNVGVLILNHGKAPVSVSETSYILQERLGRKYHFLFTLICIIVCVTFFPLWIASTPDNFQFLVFLSCAGVLFAGSTPFFRESLEKPIHYTAAIITAITYILWFIFVGDTDWLFYTLCAIVFTIFAVWSTRVWLYFVEIYGIIMLAIYLTIH